MKVIQSVCFTAANNYHMLDLFPKVMVIIELDVKDTNSFSSKSLSIFRNQTNNHNIHAQLKSIRKIIFLLPCKLPSFGFISSSSKRLLRLIHEANN